MASQGLKTLRPSRTSSQEVLPGRPSAYQEESAYRPKVDETLEKFKVYALYGGLSLVVVGGAFIGIRYLIRNAKRTSTVRDALDTGSAASYATRLKMAFENDNYLGWGTDEDVIRDMFEHEIKSHKMYDDIQRAYSNLYSGRLLNDDLKDELASGDYNFIMQKLGEKP